jgi:hypothetical protein
MDDYTLATNKKILKKSAEDSPDPVIFWVVNSRHFVKIF